MYAAAEDTRHRCPALASGGCARRLGDSPVRGVAAFPAGKVGVGGRLCTLHARHFAGKCSYLFRFIAARRRAFRGADNILSHARGQGGRGNLGEEGRGEARLPAAAAAAAAGYTPLHPRGRPAAPCSITGLWLLRWRFNTCASHVHVRATWIGMISAETDELLMWDPK